MQTQSLQQNGYLKPSGSPIRRTLSAKLMTAIVSWLLSFLTLVAMTGMLTRPLQERSKTAHLAGHLNFQLTHWQHTPTPDWRQQTTQTLHELAQSAAHLDTADALAFVPLKQQTEYVLHQPIRLPEDMTTLQNALDAYATQLEAKNARNIRYLYWVRWALVAWIITSTWACLLMLRRWVLNPLTDIHRAIEQVTSGSLNTHVQIQSQDEFQAVGEGFNRMTLTLQDMYANLENKVAEKTAELQRRHDEWETLYRISAALQYQPFGTAMQSDFLLHVLSLWQLERGAILWQHGEHHQVGATHNMPSDTLMALVAHWDTQASGSLRTDHHSIGVSFADHDYTLTAIYAHQTYKGLLLLHTPKGYLKDDDARLAALLASHLGAACENDEAAQMRWHNAVWEERNLLAQGLHDSLAQSLLFLNMRFQMLRKDENGTQNPVMRDNLALIQEGIDACHADVRELLNGFRTRFDCGDLLGSIQQLTQRFTEETGIKTDVYLLSDEVSVSHTQAIQLLFIAQEALSNIRKHSHASHAEITLDGENDLVMEIHDNGIGFALDPTPENGHIGLQVMRERAERIGASYTIDSNPQHGTRISVMLAADHR